MKTMEAGIAEVDARGFEPLTSSVSGKRSKPTELSVRKANALQLQGVINIVTFSP